MGLSLVSEHVPVLRIYRRKGVNRADRIVLKGEAESMDVSDERTDKKGGKR
jgi:hypothetical protein